MSPFTTVGGDQAVEFLLRRLQRGGFVGSYKSCAS